jgi:quercetin dioxygenase-like cupin family protein
MQTLRSALMALTLGAMSLMGLTGNAVAHKAPPAISATPLLTAQETTVLGQTIEYPTSGAAQVSSSLLVIPRGASTGWHRHDAPLYAYVLSGTLTVDYDGGITKTYTKGGAIMEAIGTRHNGHNDGKEAVRLLVVNVGAAGVANSVKLP